MATISLKAATMAVANIKERVVVFFRKLESHFQWSHEDEVLSNDVRKTGRRMKSKPFFDGQRSVQNFHGNEWYDRQAEMLGHLYLSQPQ